MKAIILAGGFGTRLKAAIPDIPKPMANVAGRPFLEYLLRQLKKADISNIVLAVGYKAESIKDTFKDGKVLGINITYSYEDAPLGTGGALKLAFAMLKEKDVVVINGDSFFDVDFKSLISSHVTAKAKITIAVKEQKDSARYGVVMVDNDNNIIRFVEKSAEKLGGLINGGIYCINEEVVKAMPESKSSLEYDIFPKWLNKGLKALKCNGFFVDIGLPESLSKINNQPEQLLGVVGLDRIN